MSEAPNQWLILSTTFRSAGVCLPERRPDGSDLHELATGFWNPFAMDFDGAGRLLCIDNDPDSRGPNRLVHILEGGDYGFKALYGPSGLHPYLASIAPHDPGSVQAHKIDGTGLALPISAIVVNGAPTLPGDADVDLADFVELHRCFAGVGEAAEPRCETFDVDHDGDVGLSDLVAFQVAYTGAR